MSVTINLPPAMEKKARGYSMLDGAVLEQMFLGYLERELEHRQEVDAVMQEFDALVKETSRRRDAPYVFNRADAYGEPLA